MADDIAENLNIRISPEDQIQVEINKLPKPDEISGLSDSEYANFLNKIYLFVDVDPSIAVQYVDIVADNFKTRLENYSKLEKPSWSDRDNMMDIGGDTKLFFWSLGHTDIDIPSSTLEKMYNGLYSKDKAVWHHTAELVDILARFDTGHKDQEGYLNLWNQMQTDTVKFLTDPQNQDFDKGFNMIDVFWAEWPQKLDDLFLRSMKEAKDSRSMKVVYSRFSNRIGQEYAETLLADASRGDEPIFEVHEIRDIKTVLGIGSPTISDMPEFYDGVAEAFKDYKPNEELNSEENNLLKTELDGREKVLDIGFGYGRHFRELKNSGKKMFGIDLVPGHAKALKKDDPNANIMIASWHYMPFADGSVDAAYCVGRSILHNRTPKEMIRFFNEASRVLTQDGVMIADKPNLDKGHYKIERDKYAKASERLGIVYHEEGAVIDSPDANHYANRFVPTDEQFIAFATIAGFSAEKIKEDPYTDGNNNENINEYWRFTKLPEPKTQEERVKRFYDILDANSKTKTASAPLFFSWL